MSAGEVALLLAGLPANLDAMSDRPLDLLRALWVEFADEISLVAPLDSWPRFQLVLAKDGFDGSTVLMTTLLNADVVGQLAGLVYELLGGRRREAGDFSPMAALG